ncbi:cytochrome P450 CYP82D47 [Hevea brasiliensis]|uniref:cytochrome P450 CYP82D47 n=1 Tax=Hevea brasiliensis TaxID=3981 RepID=UPI000B78FAA5|nr:cytochrome P450 CYP82D47 [Hevea brasiliensis]
MDYLLSFPTDALAAVFALLLLLYYLSRNRRKKRAAPEAEGAWPLIGHLHLLGGPQPPYMVLSNVADKIGPIFTIRMGMHITLIVSNWETAKECLTTNDKVFATRPKTLATEIMGYNRSMFGFIPYGPYWRQVRKIATHELLSNHRLEMLKNVRESEVRKFLKELYKLWDKSKNSSNKVLLEMKRWFGDISLNVIFRIIVGKSVGYMSTNVGEDSEVWKQALRDFFDLSGRFVPADAVPFLRWLDIGGFEKAMMKTAKELDHVVEVWLNEHKEKRASGFNQEEEDFMDLMLNILDETEIVEGPDSDTMNKATCLGLLLAASDTTTVTLTWALSLLVNNPKARKKAQSELDVHVGRERQVQESDMKNLIYLQAILKETMRLYPAGPLSLPHESTEHCTVGGYNIPAGTRLLLNIWKIHHDPQVWENPFEFRPERFLTTHKDIDVRGKNFEFIPFGSGRRMCPGISFALQVMQLTLAKLLHGFDIENPSDEPIDMTESIGLTNLRATPLEVLMSPRLPAHLYL